MQPETSPLTYQQLLIYKHLTMSIGTTDPTKAARLFHALSDETRLQILESLRSGEQCVCDLTAAFKTGQSRLSFHLKVLKDAGLVNDRPDGRWIYYSLNRAGLDELAQFIGDLRKKGHASSPSQCC
jgi:ArsR family transcriptional regulator